MLDVFVCIKLITFTWKITSKPFTYRSRTLCIYSWVKCMFYC